jgi:hypothetical protein
MAKRRVTKRRGRGGTTMKTTPREWLGIGLLALMLMALLVLLVTAALPAGEATEAAVRALRNA